METVTAEKELFRSCEVIFGPDLTISREFLDYLQISGIKSAYRKRAMETHPDRAALQDSWAHRHDHDLFHSVQEAYENLRNFLEAKDKGYCLPSPAPVYQAPPNNRPPRPAQPRPHRPQQTTTKRGSAGARQQTSNSSQTKTDFRGTSNPTPVFWDTESLYQGPLPNRRLLLGHFLYYSGLINWRTIIQALIWQRSERPRLGEIGQRFGLLNEAEVVHILRNRPILQPFGQTAVDLGLLSHPQIQMLVTHQKRLQKKFGEFFLEKRLLDSNELRSLLHQYQEHNTRISEQMQGSNFRR